MTTTTTTRY